MREKYEEIFVELGCGLIGSICNISTEDFVAFLYRNKKLSEDVVAQLDFLADVVECLEGAYRRFSGSIGKWFYRERKELGGHSPHFLLFHTWKPDEPIPQKILFLAKSIRDGNAT